MKRARRLEPEKGALDLTDEALYLLRAIPAGGLCAYYAGAIPFVLGLLYFWADMSRAALAHQRCLAASLGLAALFLWMKCWQSVFTAAVRAHLARQPAPRWGLRRVLRLAAVQTAIQPLGLLALPATLLTLLGFAPLYALFQNVTVLGDGESRDVAAILRRAWARAIEWPRQNLLLLWLFCPWTLILGIGLTFGLGRLALPLVVETQGPFAEDLWFIVGLILVLHVVLPFSPFGCAVAGNVATTLVLIPGFLRSVCGIENLYTIGGWHAVLSTTFLATVCGIAFLCLDPVLKTVYTLRCFYGEARTSGEDIRGALRRLAARRAAEEAT